MVNKKSRWMGVVLLPILLGAVALVAGACLGKGKHLAVAAAVVGPILALAATVGALITPDYPGGHPQDLRPYQLVGLIGAVLFVYSCVAAVRLAKPQSRWARRYNEEKLNRSRSRYEHQRSKSVTL